MTRQDETGLLTDLHQREFHRRGYRLEVVRGRLGRDTAEAIIQMWLVAGALSPAEARRRVQEVVCVLRDPAGKLVGVNTVYAARLPGQERPYHFYRTFLLRTARGITAVPRCMLRLAVDHLRGTERANGAQGLVVVTENPKLMRRGAMTALSELGLERIGRDARGCDVWCLHYDGSQPPDSLPPAPGDP